MDTKLLTLALCTSLACGGKSSTPNPNSGTPLVAAADEDTPDGLDLRVSDGRQGPKPFDRAKLAPATKLDASATRALLARAKPITTDAQDQQAFALRPRSKPVPRTGTTITGAFPPPPSSLLPPKANDRGQALKILRYMPEGKVPVAPSLSVTFSQPMVAVTSQGDASGTQPVKLTPQPKGNWRWLGTRTVLFDPDIRFPQATTYTVEVPAGTRSQSGGALSTGTTFTFETPPPTVIGGYPDSNTPQRRDVPMFLLFDQKIDPQAVLTKLHVTADGKTFGVTLLDAAAIAKDKRLAAVVDSANKGVQGGQRDDHRWLAFRTDRELPADATVTIEVPAGTPSAEGPNTTTQKQQRTFKTYPPLRIEDHDCGYNHKCPPGTPFVIEFDNPLDADAFDADDAKLISISPAVPDVHVSVSGNSLYLQGLTKAQTTYEVKVGANIRDEFGQTLGDDAELEFHVTDAVPTFFGPSGLVVVDPSAKTPSLDFFTTNYEQLKVRLYKVTPSDFDAYGNYLANQWRKDNPPRVPGTKVFDQLVKTTGGNNQLVETAVDLAPALSRGLGHAIAIVEPYPWTESYAPPKLISWVQATKLGLDAHADADSLVAQVSDLATGKAIGGVSLELRPSGVTGSSDDRGLATLALPSASLNKGANLLLARRGADVAFVAENPYYNGYGTWTKHVQPSTLAWYVVDDRKLYKPGEEVSLVGWLRTLDLGKHGDVDPMPQGIGSLTYRVIDARRNEIAKGTAKVNAAGAWNAKFTLPKTPNLGYATVELQARGYGGPGSGHSHTIRIEEFRRPEFEVSAQASQGPFLVGGGGDVTVSAKYYSGGPLPGAPVSWYVTSSRTSFTPPGRDDYIFGSWVPWWGYDDGASEYHAPKTWSHTGKTDAIGANTLHLDFLSVKPATPMSVVANASVTDVNRQTWSASAALLVHPSKLYVGLKTKKMFVDKGTPFEIDAIGVDLDGKPVAGTAIEVTAARLDWKYQKGKYTQLEVDPQDCKVSAKPAGADGKPVPSPCTFQTPKGGTYRVTATIVDDKGRPNQTQLLFWVAGGDRPKSRDVTQERVQLIPDHKDYAPGSTAELLVQAPFYPAEGIVTWQRSGIVKLDKIKLDGPTTVIRVPIEDAMTPNLHVQVDLVGAAERLDDKGDPDPSLPKRPAYAVGEIDLSIPPRQRTLAVAVKPSADKVSPGETTRLSIAVKDATGKPVPNADVAVIVVDEAILALTGYQFPDPIAAFYPQRAGGVRDAYSRAYVKLAKPDATKLAANQHGVDKVADLAPTATAAPGGAPPPPPEAPEEKPSAEAERLKKDAPTGGKLARQQAQTGKGSGGAPIAIRSNFNPLAAFAPEVTTDASGRASVEVEMPDNLTRYRIVAIATSGSKEFGKGENAVTARLPLMVRPSPPRFLNFGDTFELPVVVQNQTDAPMTVSLAARTSNALLTDGAGRRVTVPANDRVEVRFPAAAEMAGTARFQLVGSAGKASDAAEVALPVWTPATTEAFATYGVIDSGAIAQPVKLPSKVVTQFGGLEVTTASTNLQALTDALLYLVRYPFECAEQRSSRVMGIVGLQDVLTAFHTKDMPTIAAMKHSVADDVEHLTQMQNSDGGFAYWERGYPSVPYLTVYVTNALTRAKAKGYEVPPAMLARAQQYLQNIESHYPSYYGPDIRHSISAYALYTRKLMGDLDIAKGQKLVADAGGPTKLGMEADGWLLGLFAGNAAAQAERAAIVRHAMNKVSETAGAANFTTSYGDGAYLLLASDRRVDAVMLESLIEEQPKNDLIPKIVTGLLAHRKAGRWLNTQENTFALLAMDKYFHVYEKATPNFVARVWLGNDYAGDHAFRGRTTDSFEIPIPMKIVATHDSQSLTIQKDGAAGRLYYRIGMTYAPASLKLDPADYGFVVTRSYEGADDPKDVTRAKDGTWHVKAGARVRVRVNMVNENRRYHVALVDPIPAGFEPMNPALAVTGPIPTDPKQQQSRGRYWWWYGPWYEHQNLRDERVEAFASLLWEGVHEYTYVARATTPGNFVVPPPKAEEMYMPETFGRGGSDRVIVE